MSLSLGTLLVAARVLDELSPRFNQRAVLGEIIGAMRRHAGRQLHGISGVAEDGARRTTWCPGVTAADRIGRDRPVGA
jgi:hypothetical protein